ncbi:MAG TPA: galactose oxidase-like domain-containing protein [Chthoniobacterales bacterium]
MHYKHTLFEDLVKVATAVTRFKQPWKYLTAACLSCAMIALVAPHVAAQPNVVGKWQTLSGSMPINPIHVGLMRNGKVLILAGSGNDDAEFDEKISQLAIWDPVADPQGSAITVQNVGWDLFCNGMAFLPDGRALIIGGTDQYDPFHGSPRAAVFDPLKQQFIQVQSMAHGRWYGTVTALGNGQLMTFSGFTQNDSEINKNVEKYEVAFGWHPEVQAPWTPRLYPWLHLLPSGLIFYSGYTPVSWIFDPVAQTWALGPTTIYNGMRTYGSSVLLPLLPPNYTPRVMITGGAPIYDVSPTAPATASTEIIDLSQPSPSWTAGPNMSAPRVEMNSVLLPNGKVLLLGGSRIDEQGDAPDPITGIPPGHLADLYDPVSNTISSAGHNNFDRLYHSNGMLMPDGTVWVSGSNPARGVYESHMEVYSPRYLFNADGTPAARPQIVSAPSIVGYGDAPFTVQVDAPNTIQSVVLMRNGAPTHGFDMEQRMIGLTFNLVNGVLKVTPPPSVNSVPSGANIAPPGYYMLFVVNNAGVPSVASFIQLTLTGANHTPPVGILNATPAPDQNGVINIQTGDSVTFTGNSVGGAATQYSWIFPEVVPDSDPLTSQKDPGPITFPIAGTYTVSLTVKDSAGATDPSPPTVTVTVVNPVPVTLNLSKTGAGGGTVTSNPAGIDCGATCSGQFFSNIKVTLTATPDGPGSTFNGWSGGWCSGKGVCVPTLDFDPTTVTANFIVTPEKLTVVKTGAGSGTVTSDLSGITCGATCSKNYNYGDSVTLTATSAAPGSTFTGWSGGGCSGTGACTVTLTSPITVTANFAPITINLNISKSGTGGGTVTSNPAGIDCGATCAAIYGYGTPVTLTAVPDAGSAFNGWSGGCTGTGDCAPDLTADASVTADFISVPPLTLVPSPLPDAEVGLDYSLTLVNGGLPPYTITPIKGVLPAGMSIDPDTGTLKGKPDIGKATSFTIKVAYQFGPSMTSTYKLVVRKPLLVATTALKAGTNNKAYSAKLKATGGKAPYAWSELTGNLVGTGLMLDSATGAITGMPAAGASLNLTFKVRDALGGEQQEDFLLTIN